MTQTPSTQSQATNKPVIQNPFRLVIIGGVAGGAATAARARRLNENADITIVERGPDVSFANCGLPYYIGGEITDRSRLSVQTPESLSSMLNITVRTNTEATSIDRDRRVVKIRDVKTGEENELLYDKLMLSPGASPLRPPIPGIDDERIFTLRTLQDMDRIKAAAEKANRVLIVGAGFIGLEMAEALVNTGKQVALVELVDQVLPQLDPEMTLRVEENLRQKGVELTLGDGIDGFEPSGNTLTAKLKSGKSIGTDLVILSIGVKPESQLAKDAGLELGIRGTIVVNEFQQTNDPDIYAAGDAVETADRITGERTILPLGGPANRQGRVAADHMFLPPEQLQPYPGSQGTAIVRVFDATAAVTGWTEKRLQKTGIDYGTVTVSDFHHASYYPGAIPVTLKIIWEKDRGHLIGAQAMGVQGVDKRIDVLATAIAAKMNVEDLCHLELAYAPPFGSARDIVNIAGFAAQNMRRGLFDATYEMPQDSNVQIVDARPATMAELHPMKGAVNIPAPELRNRLKELDPSRPVVTACAMGKMSYFAARILRENGFDAKSLIGGLRIRKGETPSPAPAAKTPTPSQAPAAPVGETVRLDATGIACPGPIMRVKKAIDAMSEGQLLEVTASDPGFGPDIEAFCKSNGLEFLGIDSKGGLITASIRKGAPLATTCSGAPSTGIRPGATLVMFSCDMDKALASFVIANGAAAMGGPVTIFFTFWGLNVLRKEGPVEVEGKTFMDNMFGAMMPRGADALPLSQMAMGGMGTAMMKYRMASKNLPNLPGLMKEAIDNGVRIVACSMSMDAMGLKKEELIDGVEIGGVADFIGASSQTGTNLFI